MTSQQKRGYLPADQQDFSEQNLPKLRNAAAEICYLLNRGYPVTAAARFVGDHYQFSERQRLALTRTVASDARIRNIQSREVTDISGKTIYIDGFNVVIGLEIAFSDSMLFCCMDGAVRDLAGLHGTYHLIPQTDLAIAALLRGLESLRVKEAVILLDKPVSHSGKLRQRILELAENCPFSLDVQTENPVDALLKTKPLVATGDAYILEVCSNWMNLVRYILDTQLCGFRCTDILPQNNT